MISTLTQRDTYSGGFFRRITSFIFDHKLIILVVLLIALALIGLANGRVAGFQSGEDSVVSGTKQTIEINKDFSFVIDRAKENEENNNLKITLSNAQRADQILINGKPASTVNGEKDFLVLNLQIDNTTNNKLNVRPVDFFRLIGQDGKNFAADVYNDPVKVEPISLKRTRVGYVVDKNQNSFKLTVGEINGEKQEIEIKF